MSQIKDHAVHPKEFKRENYLNTAQAAYELDIATGTLQNWRSQGEGPDFIRHRRKIYYLRTEIDRYIRENFGRFSSTSEYKELEYLNK